MCQGIIVVAAAGSLCTAFVEVACLQLAKVVEHLKVGINHQFKCLLVIYSQRVSVQLHTERTNELFQVSSVWMWMCVCVCQCACIWVAMTFWQLKLPWVVIFGWKWILFLAISEVMRYQLHCSQPVSQSRHSSRTGVTAFSVSLVVFFFDNHLDAKVLGGFIYGNRQKVCKKYG